MKKNIALYTAIITSFCLFSKGSIGQEPAAVVDGQKPEEILLEARQKLEDAERLAAKMIEAARVESMLIRESNQSKNTLGSVKNEVIAIEARAVTLPVLLQQIMPTHWRIFLDVDQEFVQSNRIDFISQKQRDSVLADLARSLNLEYQYFHGITDSKGRPSPLLVVTKAQ